jgi:hypothetical protein
MPLYRTAFQNIDSGQKVSRFFTRHKVQGGEIILQIGSNPLMRRFIIPILFRIPIFNRDNSGLLYVQVLINDLALLRFLKGGKMVYVLGALWGCYLRFCYFYYWSSMNMFINIGFHMFLILLDLLQIIPMFLIKILIQNIIEVHYADLFFLLIRRRQSSKRQVLLLFLSLLEMSRRQRLLIVYKRGIIFWVFRILPFTNNIIIIIVVVRIITIIVCIFVVARIVVYLGHLIFRKHYFELVGGVIFLRQNGHRLLSGVTMEQLSLE